MRDDKKGIEIDRDNTFELYMELAVSIDRK